MGASTGTGLVHFCYHVGLEQAWEIDKMKAWLQDSNAGPGKISLKRWAVEI